MGGWLSLKRFTRAQQRLPAPILEHDARIFDLRIRSHREALRNGHAMSLQTTVLFADLVGSTGVFEALGNALASQLVTQRTQRIASACVGSGGRVVKTLGDGLLAVFPHASDAIRAAVDMQRENLQWLAISSAATRMPLRVGVARGAVEFVDGDCYGDAVNVASRLCDLSGPSQIWTSSAAALDSTQHVGLQFRPLGQITVRGRTKPCAVFQLDWQDEAHTDFMVMQATIQPDHPFPEPTAPGREIELSWIDQQLRFSSSQLPVHIGRDRQAQFVVSDPRVSRAHARIDWRNGSMVLVDLSSYGCWVRYAGSSADLPLRREECLLHGSGEVALGAPFADPSAATLSFRVR